MVSEDICYWIEPCKQMRAMLLGSKRSPIGDDGWYGLYLLEWRRFTDSLSSYASRIRAFFHKYLLPLSFRTVFLLLIRSHYHHSCMVSITSFILLLSSRCANMVWQLMPTQIYFELDINYDWIINISWISVVLFRVIPVKIFLSISHHSWKYNEV